MGTNLAPPCPLPFLTASSCPFAEKGKKNLRKVPGKERSREQKGYKCLRNVSGQKRLSEEKGKKSLINVPGKERLNEEKGRKV
jgi:hypothetical protein